MASSTSYTVHQLRDILVQWIEQEGIGKYYPWEELEQWELERYVIYAFPNIELKDAALAASWSAWLVIFEEWLSTIEGSLEESITKFSNCLDDDWVSDDYKQEILIKSFQSLQLKAMEGMPERWKNVFKDNLNFYFRSLIEERKQYEAKNYPDFQAYKNQRKDSSGARIWINLIERLYHQPCSEELNALPELEELRTTAAEIFALSRDYYKISHYLSYKSYYRILRVLRQQERLSPLDCEERAKEEIIKSVEMFQIDREKIEKKIKKENEKELEIYIDQLGAWAYGADVWAWESIKINTHHHRESSSSMNEKRLRCNKEEIFTGIYYADRQTSDLPAPVKMKIPYTSLEGEDAYADAYQIMTNIYVMPEALILFWIEGDDQSTSDLIDTQDAKEKFVRGIRHNIREIKEGYSGKLLIDYFVENTFHFFELKNGEKAGGILIMAPTNNQTAKGIFNYELPYPFDQALAGQPTGSIITTYPHVYMEPWENFDKTLTHNLLHAFKSLQGEYTSDTINIYSYLGEGYSSSNTTYRIMINDISITNRTESIFNGIFPPLIGDDYVTESSIIQDNLKMNRGHIYLNKSKKLLYYPSDLFKIPSKRSENLNIPTYDSLLTKIGPYEFTFQNNVYYPDETKEISRFSQAFERVSWRDVLSGRKEEIENVFKRVKLPTFYGGKFTNSKKEVYDNERSLYTIFPSVVHILNEKVGNTPETVLDYRHWTTVLSKHITADSFAIANLFRFYSLSENLANILGIHYGLVDWNLQSASPEEAALSVISLIGIPHSKGTPLEEVLLNRLYSENEIAPYLESAETPSFYIREYRERRNVNWSAFLYNQLNNLAIPIIKDIYLRAEQSIYISFAQVIAMVEYKASLIREQIQADVDIDALDMAFLVMNDYLHGMMDDLLVKVAVNIKESMHHALLYLINQLCDQKLTDFTVEFMKRSKQEFIGEYEDEKAAASLFEDHISHLKEDVFEYSERIKIVVEALDQAYGLWPSTHNLLHTEPPLFLDIKADFREGSHIDIDQIKVKWMLPLNIPYDLIHCINIVFEEYDNDGNIINTVSVPVEDQSLEIIPMLPLTEETYLWKVYFIDSHGVNISTKKSEIKYAYQEDKQVLQYDFNALENGNLPIFRPCVGSVFRIISEESNMALTHGEIREEDQGKFKEFPNRINYYADLIQEPVSNDIKQLWRLNRSYQIEEKKLEINDKDYFVFENIASGMMINRATLKSSNEKIVFCSDDIKNGNSFFNPDVGKWGRFRLRDLEKDLGIGFKQGDEDNDKKGKKVSVITIEDDNPLYEWRLVDANIEIPVTDGIYYISSEVTKMFLDRNLPIEDDTTVIQWPIASKEYPPIWQVQEFDSGYVKLFNLQNKKFLSEDESDGQVVEDEDFYYYELEANPSKFYGQFDLYYDQGWRISNHAFGNGTLQVKNDIDYNVPEPLISAVGFDHLSKFRFTPFPSLGRGYYILFDTGDALTYEANAFGQLAKKKKDSQDKNQQWWLMPATGADDFHIINHNGMRLFAIDDTLGVFSIADTTGENSKVRWRLAYQDKGWKIISAEDNKVIAYVGAKTQLLQMRDDTSTRFTFEALSDQTNQLKKYYSIRPAMEPDLAMSAKDEFVSSTIIMTGYDKNDPKQLWEIEYLEGNICFIMNVYSKRYINVWKGFNTEGYNIIQWREKGDGKEPGDNEKWELQNIQHYSFEGPSRWNCIVQHSKKALTGKIVEEEGELRLVQADIDDNNSNYLQQWVIEPVLYKPKNK
ncbi:hypothetical protein CJF12_14545 [Chryseobacterium piperi]|nr:hypothetical protein CJF12_14545 [Chryseobacterium piperi]